MPTARDAVYAAMKELGGTRSIHEVSAWIGENFEQRWKAIPTTMADLVLEGNSSTGYPPTQRFLERVSEGEYRIRPDWVESGITTQSDDETLATAILSALSDPNAVLQAIEEYDRLGRAEFHDRYGFGPAKWWYLVHNQKQYDSKAIAGVAVGIQFGHSVRLNNFKGGEQSVVRKLRALGFTVVRTSITDDFVRLPEEVSESFPEGDRIQVWVNKTERSTQARLRCIEIHGTRCAVCEMDFASVYGQEFADLIHVHHLHPMARREGRVVTDPRADLTPVCPNCHAVIHYRNALRTPEQIRAALASGRLLQQSR